MGLVLWIDQNTFASSLLEKVFKKKALPFYTIPTVDDFTYLVTDLRPAVIVLDGETARKNLAALKSQYETSVDLQALPFILLECGDECSFIKKVTGRIERPFDPFNIPEIIKNFGTDTHP